MATVFLSYDHDDVERAAPIASALEKAGHSVWWDRHIQGGAQYNDEIEAAVEAANAVVVLWSERSIRSTWVRDEAAEGRDQNKLVPVLLDAVKPPMGFRQFQTIDLSRSGRGASGSSLQQILDSIDKVAGISQARSPASAAKWSMRFPDGISRRAGLVIAAIALAAIAALIAWSWRGQQALPVVAVEASDSAQKSQTLAQDLFVKMGMLEHVGAGKWVLADPQAENSLPDLLFRVTETGSAAQQQASLVLVDAKRDSLLWSREFAQPGASEADVREQVALAAGVALTCALEAREDGGLPPDLAKRYLAGCAEAAVSSDMELDKTVAAMRSIIAKQPRFKPAWGTLLMAQDGVVAVATLGGAEEAAGPRRTLIQDIENARKIAPDLPEINLVEISLLPPADFGGRLDRVARAKRQGPDKAAIWGLESHLLQYVGRMFEASVSAKRAAELEPLSPAAANRAIMTYAYGGRIESAKKELIRSEKKWAGTAALADVQWAFHLRYGDPKFAMALRPQVADVYLRARLDPTQANINAAVADATRAFLSIDAEFGYAIQSLAEFDRTDEVFGCFARVTNSQLASNSYLLFRQALADVRHDRRFMGVAKRAGLVSYWQNSGKWPDFCYDPKLPYECTKEAAKLGA